MNCVTFDIVKSGTSRPFIPRACVVTTEKSVSVLQPNVTITIWTEGQPTGFKMPKEAIDALRAGVTECYLYGWITYQDIFDRPHRFKFLMLMSEDLASFSSYGGKEYNDAD
jgi:hypothetical protein